MSNPNPGQMKAPYRFVPASETVVTPHWAPYISHDIPFADGLNGEISFEIEAKSDIFVGDGKTEATNQTLEFSNQNGRYFIPAATLKGMVRNLVEILSFGSLNKGVLNNEKKFPIRSLSHLEYRRKVPQRRLQAGLLSLKGDKYLFCSLSDGPLENEPVQHELSTNTFSWIHKKKSYRIDKAGQIKGQIVESYSDRNGKRYHVFKNKKVSNFYNVAPAVVDRFRHTYKTKAKTDALKNYFAHQWQQLESSCEIPIWGIVEDDRILHFGLAPDYPMDGKQGDYVPGISVNPYPGRQLVAGLLQVEKRTERENENGDEEETSYFFTPVIEGRVQESELRDYSFYKDGKLLKFNAKNSYYYRPSLTGKSTCLIVKTGFLEPPKQIHATYVFLKDNKATKIPVERQTVEAFKRAYDYSNSSSNADQMKKAVKKYNHRLKQLDSGIPDYGMPVWATIENGKVKHFGLSTNYRVESKIDVHEAIDNAQTPTSKPDLAECIFGYIADDKSLNRIDNEGQEIKAHHFLRGRVHFRSAPVIGKAEPVNVPIEATLSTPSPSFFPSYLQGSATYLNEKAKISGWKRYPIKNQFYDGKKKQEDRNGTEEMKVKFEPLKKGATFSASLHFHNLRPIELGALLSALTLHGTMKKEGIYYNIGMGKPLGLGKIKLSEPNLKFHKSTYEQGTLDPSTDYHTYLRDFEAYMNAVRPEGETLWHKSPSITQLCAMCQEADDNKLKYIGLQEGGRAKNKGWSFRPYPEGPIKVPNLVDRAKIVQTREQLASEREPTKQPIRLTKQQHNQLKRQLLSWVQEKISSIS